MEHTKYVKLVTSASEDNTYQINALINVRSVTINKIQEFKILSKENFSDCTIQTNSIIRALAYVKGRYILSVQSRKFPRL